MDFDRKNIIDFISDNEEDEVNQNLFRTEESKIFNLDSSHLRSTQTL